VDDMVEWVLEMEIRPGQAEQVQPLVDEMVAATARDEAGALGYAYYLDAAGNRCTVVERYADSGAVMAHLANFGAHFAERFLAAFAPLRFTVYGSPDDEVRSALAAFAPGYARRIAGFQR
jgi:quinol monooxygenase YgiN